jgi:hypothetical protein
MTTLMRETILAAGALALVIILTRLAPVTAAVPSRTSGETFVRVSGGCLSGPGTAPRDEASDSSDDGDPQPFRSSRWWVKVPPRPPTD